MLRLPTLSLLLLVSISSFAQNYQPLYGPRHQVFKYLIDETATTVNEFFHVRIDVQTSNIWHLPHLAEQITYNEYSLQNEHDLGAFMVAQPGGVYEFHSTETGDTIFLHTQMPVNTPWSFRSDSNITAEILGRSTATVFGNTQDSLITIGLSDGNVIWLSQNYGMVKFPRFSSYFGGDAMLHYTLTEKADIPTIRDYFGWNPGDFFGDYDSPFDGKTYYRRYDVLSASVSADSNFLQFELQRRTVTLWPGVDTTDVTDTLSLIVNELSHPALLLGTREYVDLGQNVISLVQKDYADSVHSGLVTRSTQYWNSNGFTSSPLPLADDNHIDYAAQLGETRYVKIGGQTSGGHYKEGWLECYSIGSYSKLPCRDLDALLTAVEGPLVEKSWLKVFPNPSRGDFVVEWDQKVAQNLSCRIIDLQGRSVWEMNSMPNLSHGRVELKTGLPPGIYILSLEKAGGGKVLRRKMVVQ